MLIRRVIAREFSPLELRKVAVVPRSTYDHHRVTNNNSKAWFPPNATHATCARQYATNATNAINARKVRNAADAQAKTQG